MPEQYLRKWQIVVSNASGQALDVSKLRCTFNIQKRVLQTASFADIVIYNLNGPTEQAIITEGYRAIVQAGYQSEIFGKIFDGTVSQPLWDRENVTDYKLTLYCIDGDSFLTRNFVSFCAEAGYKYKDIISQMAKSARTPIPIGKISENISQKTSPRGKVVFGDPRTTFRSIAKDNSAQIYVNDGQLEIVNLKTDVPAGEALVITPNTGLIGTPQQTDLGFSFRCLLNPRIQITNPPMLIKLDNSLIRQQKKNIGSSPSMLDQDMVGQVIGVNYIGDTRGNEWYVDVECVQSGKAGILMLLGRMTNP